MKFQDLISSLGGFAQVVLTIAAIIGMFDFDFSEKDEY